LFRDRTDAGKQIAELLGDLPSDALVLGIPRGGVAVARAVADALGLELDVVLARKMRAPMQPELAIGAVAPDGTAVLDERVLGEIGILTKEFLDDEIERRVAEVDERLRRYRGDRPPLAVEGRTCVVVDDGIATGSTARAACLWLKRRGAAQVILAVPVAPARSLAELETIADRVVCPMVPDHFFAVGQFYEDFQQTTDDQVVELLAR